MAALERPGMGNLARLAAEHVQRMDLLSTVLFVRQSMVQKFVWETCFSAQVPETFDL